MAELLQRFSGNPFATPVGQKIEQATDHLLTSENWALNMEICDLINETEDGARDAVRAIKKRLQQNVGKNFTVFMFTLTVLETCVKNCGKRFHVLVTNKDFVQDLVKLIGPKNDPPPVVQEKVLSLIQSWAEAFHGQPELQGVSIVYNELRNKGFEFPKSSVESKVPIHTPQRCISSSNRSEPIPTSPSIQQPSSTTSPSSSFIPTSMSPPQRSVSINSAGPSVLQPPTSQSSEVYPIHLSPEQMTKLKNELEFVQGNMKVLSEMLTEMKPGQEHKDDLELLVDLFQTCQSMQKRIVELIEKVANEEVTNELLRINDELNNLFMRYGRYQKKREGQSTGPDVIMAASTSTSSTKFQQQPQQSTSNNIPSLIDFTDDEPDSSTAKIAKDMEDNLKISSSTNKTTKAVGDQEFDMFAQQRSSNSIICATSTLTSSSATITSTTSSKTDPNGLLMLGSSSVPSTSGGDSLKQPYESKEIDEIEKWLNERPNTTTSMQFEQFLAHRADVLEQQPLKSKDHDTSLI